jgi:AGZA family xanthine/uracil permease-like MFS transporter
MKFVRGDIDGFFGLFIDNLLQLMLIKALCENVCGFPADMVNRVILPGAALSILGGNAFYYWQAKKLMASTGRDDITALPYGINTVSMLAYIFFVMGPVYWQTQDVSLAWQVGLFACFMSGVIEILGAFCADWLRRVTPRAALLSALAGIAITFIAVGYVFRIFAYPSIAIVPMVLILVTYAGKARMPGGLPGGMVAVLLGIALTFVMKSLGFTSWTAPPETYTSALYLPGTSSELFTFIFSKEGWRYMGVIIPMGLFNVIGSLQNLESAEAAGDSFPSKPSLLANGLGTMVAAFFGSPFPTTIYIGHPAWKAMGARAGYSLINGLVIVVLCLIGGITLILQYVPIEVTLGILLWIGITITGQAFEAVPKKHFIAVAIGLIPCMAAWALYLIEQSVMVAGNMTVPLMDLVESFKARDIYLHGIISLERGFLISSMIYSAILVKIVERQFLSASAWFGVACGAAFFGMIHAYTLQPTGIHYKLGIMAAPDFVLAYALCAILLILIHYMQKKQADAPA